MPSTDPQELLRVAVQNIRIHKFEIVEPSLDDIFMEKVGTKKTPGDASDQESEFVTD